MDNEDEGACEEEEVVVAGHFLDVMRVGLEGIRRTDG